MIRAACIQPRAPRRASALAVLALAAACGEVGGGASTDDDPTITALSPTSGPATGGIAITVTGERLEAGEPVVLVGGILAPTATLVSDTQLTFVLPPGLEGDIVDVTVANQNGFAVSTSSFEYNLKPVVLGISPPTGRNLGGTQVTVVGRGFQDNAAGVPTLMVGGAPATDVQIIDDRTLIATTTAIPLTVKTFTALDVVLTNANGESTLAGSFIATARGLIALERGQGRMFYVNGTDGGTVELRQPDHRVRACAVGPDGTLFGVGRSTLDGRHELITFDPITGSTVIIGKLDSGPDVNHGLSSIAFVGTKLLGMDTGQGARTNQLVEINTTTGGVTLVGTPLAVQRGNAIAADASGSLFYADRSDGTLNTVTTAGKMTVGPQITGGTCSVPSDCASGFVCTLNSCLRNTQVVHGMVNAGATLYLIERSFPSSIFTVNPATGVATLLNTFSTSIVGACETPPNF